MITHPRFVPLSALGAALMSLMLASGCATQEAVSEQTAPIHERLAHLERSLQSTTATAQAAQDLALASQARDAELSRLLEALRAEFSALWDQQAAQGGRAQQTEARLADLAAQAGGLQADAAAAEARTAGLAERVTQAELRLDELATQVRAALAAASEDYIRLHGKVVSSTVLTEDKTLYPINSPELGGADRAKLDDLASRLKARKDDYHLDIQGHTDNLGTDDYNYQLGRARAEVVKRYLHERGGIPLSRMSVISYGATQPAGAAGSGNRRIVVNVLVLEK